MKLSGASTPQSAKTLKERVSVCEKEILELKKESKSAMSDAVKYYIRNVLFVGDSIQRDIIITDLNISLQKKIIHFIFQE